MNTLTYEAKILAIDFIFDSGKSLNLDIDIG